MIYKDIANVDRLAKEVKNREIGLLKKSNLMLFKQRVYGKLIDRGMLNKIASSAVYYLRIAVPEGMYLSPQVEKSVEELENKVVSLIEAMVRVGRTSKSDIKSILDFKGDSVPVDMDNMT